MTGTQPLAIIRHQFAVLFLVFRMATLFTGAPSALAAGTSESVITEAPVIALQQAFSPEQFLVLTNQARAEIGEAPLAINGQLNSAAEAKALDMVARGYWGHFSPDNLAPWDFIKNAGYSYSVAGENLARGFRTPGGITKAWLESPTHRANLLSDKYKEVGFASVRTEGEDGEVVLLTVQMFGTR